MTFTLISFIIIVILRSSTSADELFEKFWSDTKELGIWRQYNNKLTLHNMLRYEEMLSRLRDTVQKQTHQNRSVENYDILTSPAKIQMYCMKN